MNAFEFRPLKPEEIEVRVERVTQKGAFFLLYKDARCDMNILDETVGNTNWKRTHTRENANCIVSIWDEEKKQWIDKEDTGTESYAEKEKGLASDSFKRACVNWGIGRELYTPIPIFLKIPTKIVNNKYVLENPYVKYKVNEIVTENRKIIKLSIKDPDGNILFDWKEKNVKEVTCSECGKKIVDYKNTSKEEIITKSIEKYGKPLCGTCSIKKAKAQKEGE